MATSTLTIIKRHIPFTPEDYTAPISVPVLMNTISLILLIAVGTLFIYNGISAEKEDELSRLNQYKAGNISLYIFLFTIIPVIYLIKDFEFAMIGLYPGDVDINLGLIIIGYTLLCQNIIFIILEKRNLE